MVTPSKHLYLLNTADITGKYEFEGTISIYGLEVTVSDGKLEIILTLKWLV